MHWFLDPIQNHYADFEGRVTRQTYWMFVLYAVLISIAISIVAQFIGPMVDVLGGLFHLAILVPSIALAARRLHDTGKSGWWQLISLIPLIGWVIILIMLALPGEEGENRFGPNPKGVSTNSEPTEAPAEIPEAGNADQPIS